MIDMTEEQKANIVEEHAQLKERYEKLKAMNLELLLAQRRAMRDYLKALECRAKKEGIDLND